MRTRASLRRACVLSLAPLAACLACAQSSSGAAPAEAAAKDSETAPSTSGRAAGTPATFKASESHAALKLYVVDKEEKPIKSIIICLVAPNEEKNCTAATDEKGYTQTLVPIGQTYQIIYLSLGGRDISTNLPIPDRPNYTLRLTLQYRLHRVGFDDDAPFVLKGVEFESGKATLKRASYKRLDTIAEYMFMKEKSRIQISGHTDNVGDPKRNKKLSERRAAACRDYLVSQGVEPDRIETVGYGDERPVAPNKTKEGRQKNRRIEAIEL